MLRNRFRFLILLVALLVPTAIIMAAGSVIVDNFQIDLVEHVDNGDDTHTFIYAVTAISQTQELSHWTLGIDTCLDHLVAPQPGGPYTTVTDIAGCGDGTYQCQEATYSAVIGGVDPTLGINGLKFEDAVPQLDTPNTHVFEITVEEFNYLTEVNVGTKTGGAEDTGQIDGPVCGTGTAVSLASSDAGPAQTFGGATTALLFAAMALLAGATLFVWRRETATVRNR